MADIKGGKLPEAQSALRISNLGEREREREGNSVD